MNTEERNMIIELADRIQSTSVSNKDPEAERLIQERITANKDAAYIMTQALLIQQQALANLHNRVHQLEQQLQSASTRKKGFFDNLFGGGQKQTGFSRPNQSTYTQQGYSHQRTGNIPPGPGGYQGTAPSQAGFGQAQYSTRGGSSFLGNAMSTAAGVAGGMALFSGIEHLMGAGHESVTEEVIQEPVADSASFLDGGSGFQGQDSLLDQGFGPADDMSDLSSGFDSSDSGNMDVGGGFDDGNFDNW